MKRAHHHAVYDLKYHLVFVTKYRRKAFNKTILIRMEEIVDNICKKWDIELIEFGGEADHIHILISGHPSFELSKFINNLKTVSSRYIRKEFSTHLSQFYWKPYLWSRAYFVCSSGGAPLAVIKKYIENQNTPKS